MQHLLPPPEKVDSINLMAKTRNQNLVCGNHADQENNFIVSTVVPLLAFVKKII